jgi:hypothetical protein
MDFEELLCLIKIREYVRDNISLPAIDRQTVSDLNGILLLLDEKIIGILTSPDFKDYIGFKDVRGAKERAAKITSIYSGLRGKK